MATDAGLIACLYPYAHGVLSHSEFTILMPENAPLRIEARMQDSSRRSSPGPATDEDSDADYGDDLAADDGHGYTPGLQLRFDHLRKNAAGFVFGTSRNCDIVLPQKQSVGRRLAPRQCVLAFDEYGRLVLRDLQSRTSSNRRGTAVEYDGQGRRLERRGFTWILSGHPFARETSQIVIALDDKLKFLLVVEQHDLNSTQYQNNVAQFPAYVRHDPDILSLGSLGIDSTGSTVTPSGAQSPATEPILLNYRRLLGKGGQAVVKRVWDVSTALEYASKEPLPDQSHRRLKAEVELLKRESHPYIVQCIPALCETTPVPKLVMECLDLGSLSDQHRHAPISLDETLTILQQGASVLTYLHDRQRPIAHRDIKPGNILVYSRLPLHIKLSDFGLSKVSDDYLKTHCGTKRYMAPEVFTGKSYDASVDIWSLGVVAYQYAHHLPDCGGRSFNGPLWTDRIIETVGDEADRLFCPLLDFLARAMLVKERKHRYSASQCLSQAQYLDPAQFRCGMQEPATPDATPANTPQASSWAPSPPHVMNPAPRPAGAHAIPVRLDYATAPPAEPVSSRTTSSRTGGGGSQPRRPRRATNNSGGGGGGAGQQAGYGIAYGQFQDPVYAPYAVEPPPGESPPGYGWAYGGAVAGSSAAAVAAAAPRDLQPPVMHTGGFGAGTAGLPPSGAGDGGWYPNVGYGEQQQGQNGAGQADGYEQPRIWGQYYPGDWQEGDGAGW